MLGSPLRVVVVGMLTIGASAALLHAAGGDCTLSRYCEEDKVDARGCCRMPPSPGGTAIFAPAQPIVAATGCPVDMVHVPGQKLALGSPDGVGRADEHPQTSVKLTGYCLDKTEVTVAAYAGCVAAGACAAPAEPASPQLMGLCNAGRAGREQHPINCVTWQQAATYCAFARKRLPSEAEWEYAAVGPDRLTYPWGNELPSAQRLNACGSECRPLSSHLGLTAEAMFHGDDGWETTAPVGSFPQSPSPVGALDMAGNVSEWVDDTYRLYTGAASAFREGPHRVVRGASFLDADPDLARGASRGHADPTRFAISIGFRCASDD